MTLPIRIIILCIFFMMSFRSYPQGVINNGKVIVKSGSYLLTQDYTANSSSTNSMSGNTSISGDWTNNSGSTLSFSSGTVTFNGSGTQTITGSNLTEFYNLTVASGASVIVPPTKYLTIGNNMTLTGNLTLQANWSSVASLIDGASGGGTNSGNLSVERILSGSVKNHFVSSPVHNAALSSIYDANNGNYHIKWYDETAGGAAGSRWATTWNALTDGRGYIATYTNTATKTFTGTLATSSDITINISKSGSTADDGWNLVGNPFPTPIHTTNFISDNSSIITGTLYFWDDDSTTGSGYSTSDYATINGSGTTAGSALGRTPGNYIPVGQAFFVEKSATGTTVLRFGNNRRTHVSKSNYTLFIPDPFVIQRYKMAMKNDQGLYNEILVAFHEKGSTDYDPMYDGKKLKGNAGISLFTLGNNLDYAIQALAPLANDEVSVPLGYVVGDAGEYEMTNVLRENIPGNMTVELVDQYANKKVNVDDTPYRFSTQAGEFRDRFILLFNGKPSGIDEDVNKLNIYITAKQLVIESMEDNDPVILNLFNSVGQLVLNKKLNLNYINRIDLPGLATGCYFVRVKNNHFSFSEKLFINP